MPKTALVINPWVADFKLYDEWMHPLGLYFLVSLLAHNGIAVHYFNCLQRNPSSRQKYGNTGEFEAEEIPKPDQYRTLKRTYKVYGQSREALEGFLSSIPCPDAIFLGSGMTYWLPGLIQTAQCIRCVFPKTTLIVGGISAKLIPEHIKKTLPDAEVFQGSLFDQSSISASAIPVLAGLKTTSWTPSFIDAYQYLTFTHHGPILSSLGCPLSCSYCASRLLQNSFFVRDPEIVVQEIAYLQSRFGVEHFAVFDDALLHAPKQNVLPLMIGIIRRTLKISLHTPNGLHVRGINSEILDLMKQAGFQTLRFGYESGEPRFVGDTSRKTTREQLAETVTMTLQSGFFNGDIGIYVMAGLFNQTPMDVLNEIDFAASLRVKVKPVFLSPVPRTELFKRYARQYPALNDDPLWHNDSFFITRLPGWSAEAMQDIADAAKNHNARLPSKPIVTI